ncbi:nitroreductase family protein, partial [Rubneribacter sp.]
MKTNPVIDAILSRRSVRRFEERSIAREDLEAIVACGQWAPSARNRQEWTFVVVDDRARLLRLAEVV